ncbi:hypothetical protein [Nocardioides hwasunensis]|uniref:Lipoprotein n=1 Tax=Nocardioides hwasunensis TaxID=397258 RepID=A0ABR8MKD9_9ACTN|nr:hypothetical protein [Nocardioides hwasunensis]MBD3916398.1 hypothetical protein [Nocardioides hwasunensis]
MNFRTRLTVTSAVLLVGSVTAACGGGGGAGAPTDASEKEFCNAQLSLLDNLDIDVTDPEASTPDEEAVADAMHSWADELEKVGTPEGISDEARDGFEETVKAARDIDASDLETPDMSALEDGLSADQKKSLETYSTYVTEKCGSMFDDIEMPELPETPESTE